MDYLLSTILNIIHKSQAYVKIFFTLQTYETLFPTLLAARILRDRTRFHPNYLSLPPSTFDSLILIILKHTVSIISVIRLKSFNKDHISLKTFQFIGRNSSLSQTSQKVYHLAAFVKLNDVEVKFTNHLFHKS